MKSIVLIIPYFGKLPSYFNMWLMSVKYNPAVDFCVLTDDTWQGDLPENVKVVQMDWKQNVEMVRHICGSDIVLYEPYKLCDYRPAYGEIYRDYIKGYDFWGHCDFDLIFGDIRAFLTEDVLEKYDRIFTRGHFCLYRNQKDINELYRKTSAYQGINYIDAFHTKYSCHFDEGYTIKSVFMDYGKGTYDAICFADVLYNNYNFKLAQDVEGKNAPQIYEWKEGKLCRLRIEQDSLLRDEFMYIHLQKRAMKNSVQKPESGFVIVPNEFCEWKKIERADILENSVNSEEYVKKYKRMRIRNIWKNIRNGALMFRLKGKLKA